MSQLLSLNPSIFIKVVDTLALKDVILLASTCRQLHQLIYETAEIWNAGMLFESDNQDIDDEVIANIVPHITRSYGIHSLKIIGLHKVTSIGILQIFDQFAHALKDIELCTSMTVIEALTEHLEAFSLKLGLLQAANSIPLTFWEYRCHHKEYMEQVTAYMSQSLPSPTDSKYTSNSHAELFARLRWLQLPTKLDDPPFEHLERIKVTITDGDDHSILLKLQSLIAYLSGANLESDTESDEQKHNEAYVDRWHTINRKQKVADIVSKLEIMHQPSIAPSIPQLSPQQPPAHSNQQQQQQQQNPYNHRQLPALPMVSGAACPEGGICTPYDRQETPIPPSPPSAVDTRKRRLAQSEPRLSSEESKRSRRSPSTSTTQPVVKVYRYRRRRSSGFESQSDQERQQHAYRHPVSN